MKNSLLLPILILTVVAIGCSWLPGVGTTNEANTVANSSNSTATSADDAGEAVSASSDPKADLEKMSERFLAIKSFRAKMEGTGKTPIITEVDYIAPDRFHIKNPPAMESIIIGKTTYLKTGNTWQKLDVDLGSAIPDMRTAFTREGMKWISDVKYEGDDTVDGKPALVYTYEGKTPGGAGGEHSSKLWIAKSDGRPVKIEATYPSGNLKKMVIKYDYETEITIEPPLK